MSDRDRYLLEDLIEYLMEQVGGSGGYLLEYLLEYLVEQVGDSGHYLLEYPLEYLPEPPTYSTKYSTGYPPAPPDIRADIRGDIRGDILLNHPPACQIFDPESPTCTEDIVLFCLGNAPGMQCFFALEMHRECSAFLT